jgi:trans-2,3-dihydro-3-hydroxyanthranilate isomerase
MFDCILCDEKERVWMSGLIFYLVDVFAQEKYAGNQLAVFMNAEALSTVEMQKIANEMHFSETTFILSSEKRNGGYDVRIFTPHVEVPFAGHPTLGTAYVIRRFVAGTGERSVVLNLKVGQIPVEFEQAQGDEEILWMRQLPPSFGKTFKVKELEKVLQLKGEDFDGRFPIQEVSTGMPFIIVPLKSLDAVKRARVNMDRLLEMASDVKGGILVFCPQTIDPRNNLHVRVFVDLNGVPEDPATGSGNGCLAGYLCRYQYFGISRVNAKVEQGYEIKRPSLLLLKARKIGDALQVDVGGRVFLIAEGKLA